MKTGHKVVRGLSEAVAHAKITRLENELEEARRKERDHADKQMKWLYREAALLRVLFQLSDALNYAKHHGEVPQ